MATTISAAPLHGVLVAGTALQGVTSLPFEHPKWGVDLASGGTLAVTLDVNTGPTGKNYPPHRVIIEANVTGFEGEDLTTADWDASWHRVEYTQDSGDIHAGDFMYGERLAIKSRRVMHAKQSVHVYRDPGKYTHQAFVYDQAGNWGTASVDIEVIDPSHTPDRIIVVALDGDFDHAPYCVSKNRVTTLADADDLARSLSGTEPKKAYFKRGETYLANETLFWANFDIDAWGPSNAPNPKLNTAPGAEYFFDVGNSYFTLQDIDTDGSHDPVGEKMKVGVAADYMDSGYLNGGLVKALGSDSMDVLLDRCSATGSSATLLYPGGVTVFAVLHECSFREFKDFVMLGGSDEGTIALIGNSIVQHEEAASGGLPRWFYTPEGSGWGRYPGNAHNGYRSASTRNSVIYGNDFFGRHGWTTQATDVWESNPIIRLNTDGLAGNRSIVSNNFIEATVVTAHANGTIIPPMNSVWEFNYFVRNPTNGSCISANGMGNTVRNNIFLIPGAASPTTGLSTIVAVGRFPPAEVTGRNEIYSNTVIDLLSSERHDGDFVQYRTYGRADTLVENNIYYAPNLDVPETADGPLDMTLLPFVPRYKGHKKSYEYWPDAYTLPAEVPVDGSFVMPYLADRNGDMTDAAAFAGHFGTHKVGITGVSDLLSAVTGSIQVAFEAGGIRITNKTAAAWPSGGVVTAWLHRGTTAMAMNTSSASPADSLKRGWLLDGAGADGAAATGLTSLRTFFAQPRRGTAHPQAAGGTPSKGATEPLAA